MTWPEVPLGELCRPKQWPTIPKTKMVAAGYPVYGANGLIGHADVFTHEHPTILIGCRGSIGSIHVTVPKSYATGNAMALGALRQDRIDLNFLSRFLSWRGFRDVTTGTSQPQLTRQSLLNVTVPLPPMDEQRRIAAILDHADALRAKRHESLVMLDDLTRAAFVDMFGDPTRSGSQKESLGHLSTIVTGNTPSRASGTNYGEGIEWIKSDNLGSRIASTAAEHLSDAGRRSARTAPAGSVLVTCIAGSPKSIGKASLIDREVAFNQQINAVIPGPRLRGRFLLEQLRVAPDLVRAKSTGGMKGLVSKSSFASIAVLAPPLAEQAEFVARVAAIDMTGDSIAHQTRDADALFASLQSRAFAGQL